MKLQDLNKSELSDRLDSLNSLIEDAIEEQKYDEEAGNDDETEIAFTIEEVEIFAELLKIYIERI